MNSESSTHLLNPESTDDGFRSRTSSVGSASRLSSAAVIFASTPDGFRPRPSSIVSATQISSNGLILASTADGFRQRPSSVASAHQLSSEGLIFASGLNDGLGGGVVLLRNSDQTTFIGTPTAITSPMGASPSQQHTQESDVGTDQTQAQPIFPFIPPPGEYYSPLNAVPMAKKTLWERYRWFIIAGTIVLLAAIVVPAAMLVSIHVDNSIHRSDTTVPVTSEHPASTSNVTRTKAPNAPIATMYPMILATGAILLDPIVRPSNNPALSFNLTSIQSSILVFSDSGFEYRVTFARSMSTTERTFTNPPYAFNYCLGANAVLCQLQVLNVATTPEAYPVGLVRWKVWVAKDSIMDGLVSVESSVVS
ncbi:hypothetical protein BJ742DRAFT_864894 [Cladochytrium replicatum]|nr:hypothetical protein BJ742DRAFT_864894 [Cladochytrium replicatum]